MTTAPCSTVAQVSNAGFLPRVILEDVGRLLSCLLARAPSLMNFPAPCGLIPLLATQAACASSQPPWGHPGHHLAWYPADRVQARGMHPCGETVV